ncbi:hypothetical protein [Marinobacter sp.]
MRVLLLTIVAMSLGAWSLGSMAQDGEHKGVRGYNDSDTEGLEQAAVLDAIYPKQGRVVIDDREYFLEGSVIINGQAISAGGATAVLREGQRLMNVMSEPEGESGRLVLKGVDTL